MYEQFIAHLQYVCTKKGIPVSCFGFVGKRKKYPFYAVTLNPRARKKKTVCFTAGIHGDEVAGPWACARFIEQYDARRYSNVGIVILPVLNPSGFNQQRRRSQSSRIDLNRHFFDEPLRREEDVIYQRLRKEQIFFLCSLHEDLHEKSFYLYNYENEEQSIYRKMVEAAEDFFPIKYARRICNDPAMGGLVTNVKDKSLENRLWCDHVPHVSAPETPGKEELSRRIDCTVKIMQVVVDYCRKQ